MANKKYTLVFTDADLKQLKHDLKIDSNPNPLYWELLLARLEAAEKAMEEASCITSHPCFTEGTKSFETLPQGLVPRVKAFDKAYWEWWKVSHDPA